MGTVHSLITDAGYDGCVLQCRCGMKEKGFVTERPWRDQASQYVFNLSHSTLERIERIKNLQGEEGESGGTRT